jgi:hypothetical protein
MNVRIAVLLLCLCLGIFLIYDIDHSRGIARRSLSLPGPSPQIVAPRPVSSWRDDFDVEKKNRQIAWCEHHWGVVAMTFTQNKSNVLCLKPQAVIRLPQADGGPP